MIILVQGSGPLNIVSHCCHFTTVHSCVFNPTILVINSIIFFVENSAEMDEVRCLTMKVAVTEAGIESWLAVCKMFCLLLVLSVAAPMLHSSLYIAISNAVLQTKLMFLLRCAVMCFKSRRCVCAEHD